MVIADLARSADLDRATVRNYLTYLDTVFLTTEVLPWSTNLTSRLSKTPEIFLTDTGLAAHLLGASEADLRRVGHPALGGLRRDLRPRRVDEAGDGERGARLHLAVPGQGRP